jgi:hypothetical protein
MSLHGVASSKLSCFSDGFLPFLENRFGSVLMSVERGKYLNMEQERKLPLGWGQINRYL